MWIYTWIFCQKVQVQTLFFTSTFSLCKLRRGSEIFMSHNRVIVIGLRAERFWLGLLEHLGFINLCTILRSPKIYELSAAAEGRQAKTPRQIDLAATFYGDFNPLTMFANRKSHFSHFHFHLFICRCHKAKAICRRLCKDDVVIAMMSKMMMIILL